MPPPADRYRVNDALGALASEFGVDLDDATLNELTHTVADVLDRAADPATRPAAPAPGRSHGRRSALVATSRINRWSFPRARRECPPRPVRPSH